MPSKGLDLYGIKAADAQTVSFSLKEPGADHASTYSVPGANILYTHHLEVDSDLPLHFYGDYSISAADCVQRACEVNALTGNISDSNMLDLLTQQQCKLCSDGVVSYGFYDAGSGYDDVSYTSHHQSYIYVGDVHRPDWMKTLVQSTRGVGRRPFSCFVLPGAHDAGMNTDDKIAEVATNVKAIAAVATAVFGALALILGVALSAVVAVLSILGASQIKQVLINLAITQKDSVTNMLNMGVRYFDFRPGYMAEVKGVKVASGDGLYHQHTLIPGMSFDSFLSEIVAWLGQHDGEIVVVSLGFAGFYDDAMKPTKDVLSERISAAIKNTAIRTGNIDDASTSYNDLVSAGKRLLFFNNGVGVNDASKADSYTDGDYATYVPAPILGRLNSMAPTPASPNQYTVLQMQGTVTNLNSLWPKLAAASSPGTSPLLMTKAKIDAGTYPWARTHLKRFNKNYPVVILNDFVDPTMSQIAQEATAQRSEQMQYVVTLPRGGIQVRNHIFIGSQTDAAWAPFNPDAAGGWNDGDILSVTCSFNLNPDTDPLPPAHEYVGLCVGACAIHDQSAVQALENQARSIPLGSSEAVGIILGQNISTQASPSPSDIFYNCQGQSTTITLQPSSRGALTNYYYHWTMTYNANNTVVNNGQDVEIVFGYGDPHLSESET